MKKWVRILMAQVWLAAAVAVAAAQTEGSVWTVDTIKTNPGQQADYLQFVEQNWARARQVLKEQGKIKSYRVLSVKPEKAQAWDVLLITEYGNRAAFDQREALFTEVFKTQEMVLINGKNSRMMAKLTSRDWGYDEPLSDTRVAGFVNRAEAEAVRVPLENYLQGHATGNPEFMKKAFHTEGKLIFIREGKYTTRTFEEYIAGMKDGKPAPDEDKRKRWIESIDVAGNAATARVILDYPTVKFVDYMTLLKIDGVWKIVNKSFYAEPKKPAGDKK